MKTLIDNNKNHKRFGEVDLLNKQAEEARKININTSVSLCKEAVSLSQVIGYTSGLAKAYLNLGIACRLSSNFETSIEYFEEAQKLYRKLDDRNGESRVLNALGNVYYSLSNYKAAID